MHAWSFLSKEQVSLGREAPPEELERGGGEGTKSALGMWRARSSSCLRTQTKGE